MNRSIGFEIAVALNRAFHLFIFQAFVATLIIDIFLLETQLSEPKSRYPDSWLVINQIENSSLNLSHGASYLYQPSRINSEGDEWPEMNIMLLPVMKP